MPTPAKATSLGSVGVLPPLGRWRRLSTAYRYLVLCLAILVPVVGAGIWLLLEEQDGNTELRYTLEVEQRLSDLLFSLQDAATSQRGYLLSGDEPFLARWRSADTDLRNELARLLGMLSSAEQQAKIVALGSMVRAYLDRLQREVEIARPADSIGIKAFRLGEASDSDMHAARELIDLIQDEQQGLLLAQLDENSWANARLKLVALAVLAAITLLAGRALRDIERRATLTRFLPAAIVPHLLGRGSRLRTGRRQSLAILFVDIRGSTARAEDLEPEVLATFMTAFRRRVTEAAERHQGVIDKFIGDGALLLFGVEETRGDEASRALASAQTLLGLIAKWNRKRDFRSPVRIGIGVHYGEVFCGVVGDAERLEFTVLGDAVNVAARLEQATKQFNQPLLASHATVAAAGALQDWREISCEPLSGRAQPIVILAPSARSGPSQHPL